MQVKQGYELKIREYFKYLYVVINQEVPTRLTIFTQRKIKKQALLESFRYLEYTKVFSLLYVGDW